MLLVLSEEHKEHLGFLSEVDSAGKWFKNCRKYSIVYVYILYLFICNKYARHIRWRLLNSGVKNFENTTIFYFCFSVSTYL